MCPALDRDLCLACRGQEKIKVPVYNELDDEKPPTETGKLVYRPCVCQLSPALQCSIVHICVKCRPRPI